MNGVAEDDVGCVDAGLVEGSDLALVCGNAEDLVGDDAVDDSDPGGQDVIGGDAEVTDAFLDDPVVGGADGPDLGAEQVELIDEVLHLREDSRAAELGEVDASDSAHLVFSQTLVHLDHFAADGEFGDFAAEIGAVAAVDEVDDLAGDETGLDGPFHELGAGIAGPEGAVAIEDGDVWGGVEDGGVEVGGLQGGDRNDGAHGGLTFTLTADSRLTRSRRTPPILREGR